MCTYIDQSNGAMMPEMVVKARGEAWDRTVGDLPSIQEFDAVFFVVMA